MLTGQIVPVRDYESFVFVFVEKSSPKADAALQVAHLNLERARDVIVLKYLGLHWLTLLRCVEVRLRCGHDSLMILAPPPALQ